MIIDIAIGVTIGGILVAYCSPLREWINKTTKRDANIIWEWWMRYKWR